MKWENLREEEFEGAIKRSGGLCVMAIGCLEKHGQHLPVGTDSLKGDKIVEWAAEKADVVMFPTTMWLGDVTASHSFDNPSKTRKHGFIGMSTQTTLTVLEELCDEIARNGFTKIIICNSHGGNSAILSLLDRSHYYKKRDYALMTVRAYDFTGALEPKNMLELVKADPEYFSMLNDEDIKTLEHFAETGTGGGHADFRETALVYGTHPHLVRPDKFDAESGRHVMRLNIPAEFGMSMYETYRANNKTVYAGFPPFGCNERIGEAAVKMSVDRLAKIFEFFKNYDDVVEVMQELKEQ